MRAFWACIAALIGGLLLPMEASAQRRVLVYGPSGQFSTNRLSTNTGVFTGINPAGTNPARIAVTVASDAMWRSMTTAQFASYNAIWMDGGGCGGDESQFAAATATRLTWSAAITGHFEIIGSDQDFHLGSSDKFLINSYHYVTSGSGTGLFVSTSCIYAGAAADTPVPWLQGIGDFRVTGDGCTDGQLLEPFGATHPVHVGITPPTSTIVLPGDLAWGCFTHSHFNRHPPSFDRIYSIGSLGAGRGVVIVNDRGGCVIDADCLTGQHCNRDASGGNPTCQTTLGNGRECTAGSQCTSGICTEGVCCNATCSGQCESCRNVGQVGLCTATTGSPVAPRTACPSFGTTCGGRCDGTTRTACTFPGTATVCNAASCMGGTAISQSLCNGTGACSPGTTTPCNPYVCGPTACLTACATDADCATGNICRASVCTPRRPLGGTCSSAADCGSGNCVDGVCCNTACNGQCEACNTDGAAGTCTAVTGAPRGTRAACSGTGTCGGTCDGTTRSACTYPGMAVTCGAASCAGGRETSAPLCDGAGNCGVARTRDCAPFVCGAMGCITMCMTDADCITGDFCNAGTCIPRRNPGENCSAASQCTSGNCVDGVCCNSACNGQCEACDGAGTMGTCSPVMGAPHGSRMACSGTGPCGGVCDGMSRTACTFPGRATSCSEASCMMGVSTVAGTCDGMGNCSAGNPLPCAPFACNGATCRTTCTVDSDCAGGFHCASGACVPNAGIGRPCSATSDCSAGVCSDGVCCDRACNGICETCRLSSAVGTCSPRPSGAVPQAQDGGVSVPSTCMTCDGMRGCTMTPDAGMPVVDAAVPMDAAPTGSYGGDGCACSTQATSSSKSVTGLLLAGLALAASRRRRRAAN